MNVISDNSTVSRDAPAQPVRTPDQNSDEIDLRELLRKLNRRRGAMAGVFFLVLVAVTLYVFQVTPRYTAATMMVLDLRQSKVVDMEAVLSGMPKDVAAIRSEIDIIQSRTLLDRVARKLRLDQDPEFNPALQEDTGPPFYQPALDWLKGLWPGEEPLQPGPEEQAALLQRSIIDSLAGELKVENPRQSYTISLSFISISPKRAADIVNTVAELYLTDQMEAKFEATRRANEWLAERLEDLQAEVNTAELAVQELRKRGNLVQARGSTVLEQQIAELNAQLIMARVDKSQAEARLRGAQEAVSRAGGTGSLSDVLASPIIQRLRADEAALQRKVAEVSQRYGPRHPEMIKINAELADVRGKLAEETNRVVESLSNELEVATAKEQALRNSLNELRGQTSSALQAEVELRELERQAQSARVMYENFMERFRETGEQDALHRPDARIISWAEAPDRPSSPRKTMALGLGAVAGMMLATMTAFLLEALDRGFRTADQMEKATGLPVLGMVPSVARRKGFPDEFVMDKPHSAMSEALRGVRTAIHLCNVDHPPKTVLVTSSLPMEGKSTLCLSMGHLTAISGAKTLLIDADLRRAALAKRVNLETLPKSRIEDVLRGEADLQEAIAVDKDSGLHLLLAHGRTPSAGELLGSKRMAGLLRDLAKVYDLVIIDTPPVMGVADAWSLARSVDALIYVVRWSETPREMVRSALNQMRNLDIRISGIVMTQVDVRQQARYGYGGYGYYYGKYKKYYQE